MSAMTPALAGVYSARWAQPPRPAIEQMLRITPDPFGIIDRFATARLVANTPFSTFERKGRARIALSAQAWHNGQQSATLESHFVAYKKQNHG